MKKRNYIAGLDGLRALAILGVIFYHLLPYSVSGGFLGVNLFFIISGYLFTLKLSELMDRPISFIRYFSQSVVKRLKTMFKPLLYTMVIVITVVAILQPKLLQNINVMFMSSLTFINNLIQIGLNISYFERHFGQSVFTHYWYLAALIQMMIIWSIVYYLIRKLLRSIAAIALVTSVMIGMSFTLMLVLFNLDNLTRVYYGTDTRFFDFLIGCLIALLHDHIVHFFKNRKFYHLQSAFGGVIGLILMILLFVVIKDDNPITYYIIFLLFDIIAVYVMSVGLESNSLLLLLLENPITRYMGRRSFTWYLWYFPILTILQVDQSEISNIMLFVFWGILVVVSELFYQLLQQRDIYGSHKLMPFYAVLLVSIRDKKWQMKIGDFIKYCCYPIFIVIVLLISPMGQNQVVAKLQEQIQVNQQLQQQQEEISTTNEVTGIATSTINTRKMTFIGDSVTLSMYQSLKEVFPNAQINGKVSRQFYHGLDVAKSMESDNHLYDEVVIMLGANSPYTKTNATEFLDYLGKDRKIYWVSLRGNKSWHSNINQMMQDLTVTYSNLKIIDWATYANAKNEWFLEDGVHPNSEGIDEMIHLLVKELK